jgi:hypothetical protein
MESPVDHAVAFRNNWFLIILVVIAGVLSFVFAFGTLVLTLTIIFPLHAYTWPRAASILEWGFGTMFSALLGLNMLAQSFKMAHSKASLDERGVDFRLGTRNHSVEVFFAWDQIAAVKYKRMAGNNYYAVVGKDNRHIEFTAYNFFRPKKLASQIAACAGQTIEEFK